MLRLLTLLQSRREWAGSELAKRLSVSDRTVRRDVGRLRALDYLVESSTGTAGGYRLVSGRNLPPLVLDDEEALAVALGLVTAAGGSVSGIEEASVRALAKLQQTLPARLRPRLSALGGATAVLPLRDTPRLDPVLLGELAAACRDEHVVTFDYQGRNADHRSPRRVQPHHLVTLRGHWYLLGYDTDRDDWRTFRVDRIDRLAITYGTFIPRALPADPATYLADSLADATYRYTAHLTVDMPADVLRDRLLTPSFATLTPLGPNQCVVRVSADSLDLTVQFVASIACLDTDFTLHAPPELTSRLRALSHRLPFDTGAG